MADVKNVKLLLNAGGETSVAPISGNDLANKTYVDAAIAGNQSVYDSVRVEADSNIDIATGGLLTIDGVTLVADDRVLLTAQTTASENGIYVAASGAWSRADDMPDAHEVKAYSHVFVREGTTYGGHEMKLQTSNVSETVGTDALVWVHAYTIDNDSAHIDYDSTGNVVITGTNVDAALDDAEAALAALGDLGTFTGTTIPDNSSTKDALQALETAVENVDVTTGALTVYDGQKATMTGQTILANQWTTFNHGVDELWPSAINIYDMDGKLLTDAFNIDIIDADNIRVQNQTATVFTDMVIVVRA